LKVLAFARGITDKISKFLALRLQHIVFFTNSPYGGSSFQPDSSGFPPQAAISHAALARGER